MKFNTICVQRIIISELLCRADTNETATQHTYCLAITAFEFTSTSHWKGSWYFTKYISRCEPNYICIFRPLPVSPSLCHGLNLGIGVNHKNNLTKENFTVIEYRSDDVTKKKKKLDFSVLDTMYRWSMMKNIHSPNWVGISSWETEIWPHEYLISPIGISVNWSGHKQLWTRPIYTDFNGAN